MEEIGNVKHARLEQQSEGLQKSSMASTMGKNMHSDTHTYTQTHTHTHTHTHTEQIGAQRLIVLD